MPCQCRLCSLGLLLDGSLFAVFAASFFASLPALLAGNSRKSSQARAEAQVQPRS